MPEQKPRKTFLEKRRDEKLEDLESITDVLVIFAGFSVLTLLLLFQIIYSFLTFYKKYSLVMQQFVPKFRFLGGLLVGTMLLVFLIYVYLALKMLKLGKKTLLKFKEINLEYRAEIQVAKILATLDPKTYYVYNGLSLGFGDIDHIVIGPTGIFVIETKANNGTLFLDENNFLDFKDGIHPRKNYRRQAIMNSLQVKHYLDDNIREVNTFTNPMLCFPYATINEKIELKSIKDRYVIPCLTKEQVVQKIYQTTGSALNQERILAIKRALDEWEEGMKEEG